MGIVTLIGGVAAGFGYDLADRLLSYVGWLGGGVAGGLAGWVGAPVVATSELPPRVGLAVGGVLVGGILGRIFVPVATRFGMVIAGFVVSAGATLAVFVGSDVTRVVTGVSPSDPASALAVAERLAALPVFESEAFTRSAVIAVVIGLFGAILAARYYTVVSTVAVTGLGAALLGIVGPLWREALDGTVSLGVGVSTFSPAVAAGVLVAGLAVQFYRHGDTTRLPGVDDEPLR